MNSSKAPIMAILLIAALTVAACNAGSPTPTPRAADTSAPAPTATATTSEVSPTPTTAATVEATPTDTTTPIAPPTSPAPQGPTVRIASVDFQVEVALTFEEQRVGLSRRERLPPRTGMIFPMVSEGIPAFWMRGMLIPLDFVWIGADCSVRDTTLNVPPPEDPDGPTSNLPIYSPSIDVLYVFEINAGEFESLGLREGDNALFFNLGSTGRSYGWTC